MDIFSTHVLTKVVENLKTPPSFLLDMFFSQELRSDTEEIYFDTQESKPRISPFVSPLMPGKVVEHEGYQTKSFKPAYVKDKRRFTPDMPFKRMAGERIGGELTPAQRLEKAVAQYEGVGYGVGVSSGTDALISSLMALGIYRSPLDSNPPVEVIVPAYTFFATAGCVWRVGARPVFVDIDPVTFNIDASKIEEKITERTKAIIPVHLFGQCAEMEKVMEIANRHGLHVVEDCAQSIGASRNGSFAGSFGDCGALSFFPTKNLGGLGDGGMVISNHKHVTDEVRRIRNHGMDPKYYHKSVGGNFRLDAIQAAALLVKIKHLDSWRDMRESNAKFYDSAFKGSDVITPKIIDGNKSVYNQYIVRVQKRDKVLFRLRELGVNCEIY